MKKHLANSFGSPLPLLLPRFWSQNNLWPLLSVCLLWCLAACTSAKPGDEVLVEFGDSQLLREEVDLFTPEGLDAADSTRYADQYIEQWVALQAMRAEGQKEVSDQDQRLRYQVARYRDQVIVQLFTEKLVEERPDVLKVSDADVVGYYSRHTQNFVAASNWYQYFYAKTTQQGQYKVVNMMRGNTQGDLDELKSWARENAVSWKLDSTYSTEEDLLRLADGFYFGDITRAVINTVYPYAHTEEGVQHYDFFRMLAVVKAGEQLPLSLCKDRIAQIIRSERKNALIDETRSILVQQAKSSGKVKDFR